MPTTTPHSSTSCQTCVIMSEINSPAAIRASAETITRRTPKRFMSAAANGPKSPNSKMRKAKADEICASLQPNSFSRGTIITPGVPIAPAVTSRTRNVTATTTHP
jgi:hypothetical protein